MAKPRSHRYRFHDNVHHIDFRISKAEQLFDTRDPAPFRERDLDDDFVRSLVNSARELEGHGPYKLCLIFGPEAKRMASKEIIDAIHQYFSFEVEFEEAELKNLRRKGFFALSLGLIFLFLCTAGAFFVSQAIPGVFGEILAEGLTIIGWVALWEPVSILLYDWLPISKKLRILRALSKIRVDIIDEA